MRILSGQDYQTVLLREDVASLVNALRPDHPMFLSVLDAAPNAIVAILVQTQDEDQRDAADLLLSNIPQTRQVVVEHTTFSAHNDADAFAVELRTADNTTALVRHVFWFSNHLTNTDYQTRYAGDADTNKTIAQRLADVLKKAQDLHKVKEDRLRALAMDTL